MTATPCSVKSVKSESLNGSWIDIDPANNESPQFHHYTMKSNSVGGNSKNSSFEKIMMDVQNELINLSMSSNSSRKGMSKEQLQQINLQLNSKSSDSPIHQLDAQQLDQLEAFDDERLRNLNPDLLWYWNENDDCKNLFNEDLKAKNLRQWCVRRGIFNKEVLSLLLLSNAISVVLGVGIGYATLIRRFL